MRIKTLGEKNCKNWLASLKQNYINIDQNQAFKEVSRFVSLNRYVNIKQVSE